MHSKVPLLLYILESHTVQFASQYKGCYKDRWYPRAFSGTSTDFDDDNNINKCVNYCGNKGRFYKSFIQQVKFF